MGKGKGKARRRRQVNKAKSRPEVIIIEVPKSMEDCQTWRDPDLAHTVFTWARQNAVPLGSVVTLTPNKGISKLMREVIADGC